MTDQSETGAEFHAIDFGNESTDELVVHVLDNVDLSMDTQSCPELENTRSRRMTPPARVGISRNDHGVFPAQFCGVADEPSPHCSPRRWPVFVDPVNIR